MWRSRLVTERITGLTGVWTQNVASEEDRRHRRAYLARRDFARFRAEREHQSRLLQADRPLRISDKPVTSLEQEMAQSPISRDRKVPALEDLAQQVARNFGRVFEAQTLWLESLDALCASTATLGYDTSPANQDTPARAPERNCASSPAKKTFILLDPLSLNAGTTPALLSPSNEVLNIRLCPHNTDTSLTAERDKVEGSPFCPSRVKRLSGQAPSTFWFSRFASSTAQLVGHPYMFLAAGWLLLVIWAASGPFFISLTPGSSSSTPAPRS